MTTSRLPGRLRRTATVARVAMVTAVAVAALTVGCSAEEDDRDPAEVLANAKAHLDETSGVQLDLSSDGLPEGVDALTDASGVATHAPAFEGEIELVVSTLPLKVPVIAVDGIVFAQLPFTGSFTDIDPGEYGAPDPAQLMDPETGLSSWLLEADGVSAGEQVRDGEDVLTPYSGTLPGEVVHGSIPSAVESGEFEVTFRIDEDDVMRAVAVTGPFYEEGGTVEYVVEFSDYGSEPQITAPPTNAPTTEP